MSFIGCNCETKKFIKTPLEVLLNSMHCVCENWLGVFPWAALINFSFEFNRDHMVQSKQSMQ